MSSSHRRQRDQRRDLESLASQFGAAVEFEHTRGQHIRAVFRAGTKASAVIIANGCGSDWRGQANNLSRARRQLRELTAR